jgi:hypothetical protein
MIGGDHDAVAGVDGFFKELKAVDLDSFDAEMSVGVPAENVMEDAWPEIASDGGDEVVGFVDDDVLHRWY